MKNILPRITVPPTFKKWAIEDFAHRFSENINLYRRTKLRSYSNNWVPCSFFNHILNVLGPLKRYM